MLTTKKPAKAFECAQTMTASRNLSARSSKSRKSAPTKPETAPTISAKTASTRMLPWSPSGRSQGSARGSFAFRIGDKRELGESHQISSPTTLFEERLLGAIGGNRTLAEILNLQRRTATAIAEPCGLERLWQYDQIVFDASRADASLRDRRGDTMNRPGYGAAPIPAEDLCDRFISTAALPGGRRPQRTPSTAAQRERSRAMHRRQN